MSKSVMDRGVDHLRTYSMSSVIKRTTKQAGTIIAMIIVLPLGFCAISGEADILIPVWMVCISEGSVRFRCVCIRRSSDFRG